MSDNLMSSHTDNASYVPIRSMALPKDGSITEIFSSKRFYEVIDSNVRLIIGTRIGELPMIPSFGCRIWAIVHELNDEATHSLAASYIREAIRLWEDRISIISIQFTIPENNEHGLQCVIKYSITVDPSGELRSLEMSLDI